MQVKYLAILPVAVVGILVGGLGLGVRPVKAAGSATWPPVAQRLAEKLGLDRTQVEGVLGQYRAERQKRHQSRVQARLQEAVNSGVITAEQMAQIQAKRDEWRDKNPDISEMSWTERREARERRHKEMETWKAERGVDILHQIMGKMRGWQRR